MSPALLPGDHLLAAAWLRPRPGDVVLARDPDQPGRVLVKRVAAVDRAGVELRGDRPEANVRDSRVFGRVPRRLILGRVVWRHRRRAR
jgi:nickel-type superoxide dismutase maturation protease